MTISLKINGKSQDVDADPSTPLLYVLRNDVGLLAEEYDPTAKRQLGNFPQAFTHVGLVNTAQVLAGMPGAASKERQR